MSGLALDESQVTPHLYATASALPAIEEYLDACLAIGRNCRFQDYPSAAPTRSPKSIPLLQPVSPLAQSHAGTWPGGKLGIIASSYGTIRIMNNVGASGAFSSLLEAEESVASQHGTATLLSERASVRPSLPSRSGCAW